MRSANMLCLALLASATLRAPASTPLRVCADPNNLPFSNQQQQGLENRLAEVLSQELKKPVVYAWWSQRERFLRKTLKADQCDIVMGLPAATPGVLTTKPYYRSGYVFVFRRDRHYTIHSLNDPLLQRVKIGIHIVGEGYAPPAEYLARRGIVQNIKGYSLYGEYGEANPPARLIDAVRRGDVDIAIAWGPLAGYFVRDTKGPTLEVIPIPASESLPAMPLVYDIAVAVRPGQQQLKTEVERALDHRRAEIRQILARYGVPVL